jgi:neurofibromin 1
VHELNCFTDVEANLFRSNSTCTRFLSAFAKIHGYNYLRDLIQPLIKTMVDMPPGHGYELNPDRVGEEIASSNQRNVEIVATSFLKIVTSSVPALPA